MPQIRNMQNRNDALPRLRGDAPKKSTQRNHPYCVLWSFNFT